MRKGKNKIEINSVRTVKIAGNPLALFLDTFFNHANRDVNQKRKAGLKGSRDDVQVERRQQKKMKKASRKKNRNGRKR